MRTVAVGAIAHRPGVRHLRRVNLFALLVMASQAERFGVALRQHNLSIFGRGVTNLALFVRERRMRELRQQFGSS